VEEEEEEEEEEEAGVIAVNCRERTCRGGLGDFTLQTWVIRPVSSSMASAALQPLLERSSATACDTLRALHASLSLSSGRVTMRALI